MGPAERLLCRLSLARIDEAECARLAAEVADWDAFFELARLNCVVPWTLRGLDTIGATPTGSGHERAVATRDAIADRNRRRSDWARRFLVPLHAEGVEVIILKGFLFAATIYRDEAYKKMNDVDILVRRADVPSVIRALRSLGFDNYRELYGKEEVSDASHHTPAYVSPDLACVVGLHWGLVRPRAPWKPDMDGIWRRRLPVQVADAPAFGMCAEDNVLHLAVHLPFYKTGLRELADVSNCILEPGFSWDALGRHVEAAHAEDPAWRVVALADALVPFAAPRPLMDAWKARAFRATRVDTERRLADPGLLLRSRSVHIGCIEKQYVMFRKTENFAEKIDTWLEMYRLLLWPAEDEASRIAGVLPPLGLRARLRVPGGLWSALARDYGHLAVCAMQVANLLSLAAAVLAWPRMRRGRRFGALPEAPLLDLLE